MHICSADISVPPPKKINCVSFLTNALGKYHTFIVREINFHIALPSCNISPNMFSYQYEQVLLIILWLILYVLRRYNKGHQSSLPSSLRRVQPLHTWHGRVYSGLYRGRSSRPRSDAGHSGRYPNSLREVYLQREANIIFYISRFCKTQTKDVNRTLSVLNN